MTQRNTVFPRRKPLTEAEFRHTWLCVLSRLCRTHGDGEVAQWLGISERHLRNIKSGVSLPSADKIWNLLAYDESAHDELDGEFGIRNVHSDEANVTDPLTLDMIALAHETAEHESPTSHGGETVTDHEILNKDEARLRRIHRTIGTWLDRSEELRRPSERMRPRAVA